MKRVELIAVDGVPEVQPGDDLGEMIGLRAILQAGDVVVVAQKVVSKAEGRIVDLDTITVTARAVDIAARLIARPDPRMVQVALNESVRVLRSERVLITETPHGFVCANSGVDHSNVGGRNALTLLPLDPDASASRLRDRLREVTGVEVGVIVSDTFGRPWRLGIVNVALGVAGLPALVDLRGSLDDDGKLALAVEARSFNAAVAASSAILVRSVASLASCRTPSRTPPSTAAGNAAWAPLTTQTLVSLR